MLTEVTSFPIYAIFIPRWGNCSKLIFGDERGEWKTLHWNKNHGQTGEKERKTLIKFSKTRIPMSMSKSVLLVLTPKRHYNIWKEKLVPNEIMKPPKFLQSDTEVVFERKRHLTWKFTGEERSHGSRPTSSAIAEAKKSLSISNPFTLARLQGGSSPVVGEVSQNSRFICTTGGGGTSILSWLRKWKIKFSPYIST